MDILAKYPQLKNLAGDPTRRDEFLRLLGSSSVEELYAIRAYVNDRIKQCEEQMWECRMQMRNAKSQDACLRSEYEKIRHLTERVGGALNKSMARIFQFPQPAMEACLQSEHQNGLDETAVVVNHNPRRFGRLRCLLPLPFGLGEMDARSAASQLPYKELRYKFEQGRTLLAWLVKTMQGEPAKGNV